MLGVRQQSGPGRGGPHRQKCGCPGGGGAVWAGLGSPQCQSRISDPGIMVKSRSWPGLAGVEARPWQGRECAGRSEGVSAGQGGAQGCGRGVGRRESREARAACGSEGLEGVRLGGSRLGLKAREGELPSAAARPWGCLGRGAEPRSLVIRDIG